MARRIYKAGHRNKSVFQMEVVKRWRVRVQGLGFRGCGGFQMEVVEGVGVRVRV